MFQALRLSLLGLLLYLSSPLQAQDQYDYTWLLGAPPNLPDKFGGGDRIDFNTGSPTVNYFETPMGLWIPCVASDQNGLLQFYSNGCEIRNHQHQLMENGAGINAGPIHNQYCVSNGYGYPAVHSLLTLPFPGHAGQYYFFHMRQYDIGFHLTWDLLWSRIDMNANGGLGKVLEKNMPLVQDTLLPSISAVRHANGRDWWIIVGEQFNDDTYCFLLDTSGVKGNPIVRHDSWIGTDQLPNVICFSPDGKKLARGGHGTPAAFRIYDFDRCNGILSNPVTVHIPEVEAYDSWPCFSPNSRYLYLTNQVSRLYQYDTWAANIDSSVQLIGEYDGFIADYNSPATLFTMTMGPDQRIYMSCNNGTRYLHVIHHPDEPGPACDFRQHDFQMPAISVFFLPNMPYYRLYNEPGTICNDAGHCDTLCRSISVQTLSAVGHLPILEVSVSLWPNPANTEVFISHPEIKISEFRLFDLDGHLVLRQPLPDHSGIEGVMVKQLPKGLYLWQICCAGRTLKSGKVVIQH